MTVPKLLTGVLVTLLVALTTFACGSPPPVSTPTPTQTSTPTATLTSTNTPTPTNSPTPTNTSTPSPTPTPSSTPTPSPTPTATATTTPYPEGDLLIHERPVDDFAIGLPPTWMPIDLSPAGFAAIIKRIGSANPDAADMLNLAQSQLITGTKFYALDLGPGAAANGTVASANIIKQTLTAQASLETLVQLSVTQLENVSFVVKPVSHKPVRLQAGQAEELRYQVKLMLPSGQTTRSFATQYLFLDGRAFYVITLVAPIDRAARYQPIFLKIGQSFRLLKFAGLTGRITFDTQRHGRGNGEIYLMNADGSAQTRLTTNTADDFQASLSPDGSQIAFVSNRDGNYEIYVMRANGSNQRRLTSNSADDVAPAWSPDGKQIAFFSGRDGNYEIYVMNADGSGQTRLTHNAADDYSPKWSPDGKQIVFFSDRAGNSDIYAMNADGSHEIRLTDNPAGDASPAWSPDGKKIAFNSARDGNSEIYIMNADGSAQTRLTNDPASDRTPAWSPDGSWIVFVSKRDGNDEIYIMRADGSVQTRLTNDPASDLFPGWGPALASP